MKKTNTLQDALLEVAEEYEQKLAAELDNHAMPHHNFTRRYQRRKRIILQRHYKHNYFTLSEWKVLAFVILLIVIVASGIRYFE